jgi:hypothetical protein
MALKVTDEAVQMFGGQGISQDTPLARSWTHLRTLRLADGPDAVHRRQIARDRTAQVHAGEMSAPMIRMKAIVVRDFGPVDQYRLCRLARA